MSHWNHNQLELNKLNSKCEFIFLDEAGQPIECCTPDGQFREVPEDPTLCLPIRWISGSLTSLKIDFLKPIKMIKK
jgi:hypothetical protein